MIYRYLAYKLTFQTPVMPATNSKTVSFIPGSIMRGVAASALGDPRNHPHRKDDFRSLILDNKVAFLNAYVCANQQRGIPAPLSLRVKADSPLEAIDITSYDRSLTDEDCSKLIPLNDRFLSFSNLTLAEPIRTLRISYSKRSDSFSITELLEAGQSFRGLIQIRANDVAECNLLESKLKQYLTSPITIGRAQHSNTEFVWQERSAREVEEGTIQEDIAKGERFCALLTSSYIGRNQHTGQLDPTYIADELVSALRHVKVLQRVWTFSIVGGFNRAWRLELPQALGCSPGSVIVLESTQRITLDTLLDIEHRGFGERLAEGFGRVAFFRPFNQKLLLRKVVGASPDLVQKKLLERAVSNVITREAIRLAMHTDDPPEVSLLRRLRSLLRTESDSALETLLDWLDSPPMTELHRQALRQIESCRVTTTSLSAWLKEIATGKENQNLSNLLQFSRIAERNYLFSLDSAKRQLQAMDRDIRIKLIDALLTELIYKQLNRNGSASLV
ncbi:MAG: hypothetical protein RMM17_00515 [Acidobacteriota bacterium]|nr:hypothetical protein [Blastocatellia bacterium]MDW8411149.1 hypothetical protein [Acidobacteriota bacterium]